MSDEVNSPEFGEAQPAGEPAAASSPVEVEFIGEDPARVEDAAPAGEAGEEDATVAEAIEDAVDERAVLESLVAERTEDLQRLQAEYVNYKKRVDRDRAQARQSGIDAVLRALMPVFDAIAAAREQGELTGGFKLTADELTKMTTGFGFEAFGIPGDEFDPRLHEALMQEPVPGSGEMTLKTVLQSGYRIGDQVIRPARVIVAVPDGSEPEAEPAEEA